MQPDINKTPRIEITMLGEFSITINGNQLTNLKGRTKRVWLLIQYLIANRRKDISLEMLVNVLWEEGECGDPLNALKNLVYRAREILKDISGDDKSEFIQFIHNAYSWNNTYDCVIDTEQFVNFCEMAKNSSHPDEMRIQYCKEALALYRDQFLPKSSYSAWAISEASDYSARYIECVLTQCKILFGLKRFDEAVCTCEAALTHIPLEESIHKVLLYAYISINQRNKALEHYNQTIELFYRELGVDISPSLKPLYKELITNIDQVQSDINNIKNDLKEASDTRGAYFCDYDAFKSIYRIQARMVERTGLSVFIVLLTLTNLENTQPEPDVSGLAMVRLKEAILSSLRKGDTVTSYSSTQFILMLPLINYENSEMVATRIIQKFKFLYRKNDMNVTAKMKSLDAIG